MFQHVTCLSWKMFHVRLENIYFLLLLSGEGNGNPLQYYCLENPVDRGDWWAAVHSVTHNRTWLKQLSMHALEKEMSTHSSILAWRIPGTEEPGGPPSMGVTRDRTRLKQLGSFCSCFWLDCSLYICEVHLE